MDLKKNGDGSVTNFRLLAIPAHVRPPIQSMQLLIQKSVQLNVQ